MKKKTKNPKTDWLGMPETTDAQIQEEVDSIINIILNKKPENDDCGDDDIEEDWDVEDEDSDDNVTPSEVEEALNSIVEVSQEEKDSILDSMFDDEQKPKKRKRKSKPEDYIPRDNRSDEEIKFCEQLLG